MPYHLPIVVRGYEDIKILNGHKVKFQGVIPAIKQWLDIGDVVLVKQDGQYRKKFSIEWLGPSIEFGPAVDPKDYGLYWTAEFQNLLQLIVPDNKDMAVSMYNSLRHYKQALSRATRKRRRK